MSRKWTESELEILRNSNGETPVIEGRSNSAIKEKMYNLGLSKPNNNLWTPEEIKMVIEGATHIEGRTPSAIKHAMRRLKVVQASQKQAIENKPFSWTEDKTNTLKDLIEHGYNVQEIYDMRIFNVTENAIQKKIKRLGLDKEIKLVKLVGETKDLFKKFLLDNWKCKTPRDLMEIWNKENASYIVNVRTVVYGLAVLNIQIPYSEIQKINDLRKKENELNLSNKGSTSQLIEKIRIERVKIMRERAEKRRDIWTGLPIPKEHETLSNQENDIWAESV